MRFPILPVGNWLESTYSRDIKPNSLHEWGSESVNTCYFSPLDVLLCLLYRRDGGLYQCDVLHLFIAPCTLVWKSCAHTTDENIRLRRAFCERNWVCLCVCLCASPSLSDDSCVGSGVVLLLSVFWLQLDGWLLAFLRFPLTSAWEEVKSTMSCNVQHANTRIETGFSCRGLNE